MRGLCAFSILIVLCTNSCADEAVWKAGVAKAVITPEQPLWMAGYGNRDHPAEGKVHDLWIRVLALQDRHGHTCIILSSDTLGITQSIYNNTCRSLKEKFDLNPAQIMLHSSHTHCGPVLRGGLYDIYPLDEEQLQRIDEGGYSTWLEERIVGTVTEALSDLVAARVSGGQGEATFAGESAEQP